MTRKSTAPTTTLNVRGIPVSAARALKASAQARGYTLGEYLHRLALLHVAVLEAGETDPRVAKTLGTLGLGRIETIGPV